MADKDEYRSKLRTPKKESEQFLWGGSSPLDEFGVFSQFLNTPSPSKRKHYPTPDVQPAASPHKSGYMLRTPSPPKKSGLFMSPVGMNKIKAEFTRTPSPHKAGTGTDLFGNRSLLDNLPIPEWDDNFLDNFQEDLFGLGNDDLEGLVRSPLKSPRRGHAFITNSPFKKCSPSVSPFKSPLLTSSPKLPVDSPSSLLKTPGVTGGRPLTRQRKLFLQSPERLMPSSSSSISNWPTPLPFASLDETSSSMFSEGANETTTSTQSISTYLKHLDDEDNEDYTVMPPVGWTTSDNLTLASKKSGGKGKGKSHRHKHTKAVVTSAAPSSCSSQASHSNLPTSSSVLNTSGSKKLKVEPQFTLLRPHTELHNNQICLRMTPRTPPNKIKISRDFSQIQTLPSKEQLRIVRNRFRETLSKALEQVLEKEQQKANEEQVVNDPALRSALQKPVVTQSIPVNLAFNYNIHGHAAKKPLPKRKKK
ncbi:uncharacterized protein LOC131952881 [Physella acuta]|uniref:uncharacterized protein LOC131952881 n=1 Tax=Physella acuta TaxID=109671 RepID=UPI0027DAC294|nr:uncharacterized protein LOC131952881 [Physella acuta]